jgi:hypothetical protein
MLDDNHDYFVSQSVYSQIKQTIKATESNKPDKAKLGNLDYMVYVL